jgi:hypothetical protein
MLLIYTLPRVLEFNYKDPNLLMHVVLLIVALAGIPSLIYYAFITFTITEQGISRWRWQGFGKPLKMIAYLHWSQIENVTLHTSRGFYPKYRRINEVRFYGTVNSKKQVLRVTTLYYDPKLEAINYAIKQLPFEFPEHIRAIIELRQKKKWHEKFSR